MRLHKKKEFQALYHLAHDKSLHDLQLLYRVNQWSSLRAQIFRQRYGRGIRESKSSLANGSAKAKVEEEKHRDQMLADQAKARNNELLAAITRLTEFQQAKLAKYQGLVQANLEVIPHQTWQLLELKNTIQA